MFLDKSHAPEETSSSQNCFFETELSSQTKGYSSIEGKFRKDAQSQKTENRPFPQS